ncbi:formamidopyrimidine-DNA glycosylase [Fragilaria crotonensis]|nr:formamidopyrimidine-DNA glycosylase [Fragilaria crotonensis]
MPELPEVESFRRLLLPLVSTSTALTIELIPLDATNADGAKKPHRYFVRKEEVLHLSNHVYLVDVQRKGKLMCMILQGVGGKDKSTNTKLECFYLFLHMGMTGRISTPNRVLTLKSMERSRDDNDNDDDDEVEEYPPKHTFIKFQCGSHEACFSDPRRFGWVAFKASLESGFGELAPDALSVLTGSSSTATADTDTATTTVDTEDARQKFLRQLTNQRVAIKTILLDQKRVISRELDC